MRRRAVLAATLGVALSGCLAGRGEEPEDPTGSPKATDSPVRRTADGVAATFRVVDAHRPTDDAASATFDGRQVTVTGTMDPGGCREPALGSVRYGAADGVVHLTVATASRFGETATVECGNASYDYRVELVVDSGDPEAVELVHDYREDAREFTLEKG